MKKILFAVFGCLGLIACVNKKKDVDIQEPKWEGPTIYSSEYGTVSRVLKNGKPINLTDGSEHSKANALFVSGSDVYVAGLHKGKGVYWKNGNIFTVPNSVELKSIYVNNNDVYVAGGSINGATYWKNSVEYNLVKKGEPDWGMFAFSIFGYNNDIYVTASKGEDAIYWKNGDPIELAKASRPQSAVAIFVTGNDVYVAGMEAQTVSGKPVLYGKYWKNGIATIFTKGSTLLNITSIFVKDDDVYIAGSEGANAKFWKNGIEVNLTDGLSQSDAQSIYVFNNDVYTAGYIDRGTYIEPAYWKNNTLLKINEVDRTRSFQATSVFVAD